MKIALALIFFIFPSFVYSSCEDGKVDLNSASLMDLQKLPGIGPAKAQSIIDLRPYYSIDDLKKVRGIGEKTIEEIKSQNLACIVVINGNFEGRPKDKETPKEQSESIINLNSEPITIEEKIVYESKNEMIKKYAIYAFSLFLVFMIAILLFDK